MSMLPEDVRNRVRAVGRQLQAADDAEWKAMLRLDVDSAQRGMIEAEAKANRDLDGLLGLHAGDIEVLRAQAVMATMLAEDHPDIPGIEDAMHEVNGWLTDAARTLLRVNQQIAEAQAERTAA